MRILGQTSQSKNLKLMLGAVVIGLLGGAVAMSAVATGSKAAPITPGRAAEDPGYKASVEKWRLAYENDLKSDHGWLTIAGLFWLHEGENRFGSSAGNDIILPAPIPADAGYFDFHGGKVTAHVNPGVPITMNGKSVSTVELRPDAGEDRLALGGLNFWVHGSGERRAIRLYDPNSKLRKNFTGLHWFPVDESYRVTARYEPYPQPKAVDINNLAGDALQLPIAGEVVFKLHGQEIRLQAEDNGSGLSFVFKDATSGKETYAASRFLSTESVKDGKVILDFNQAYNPPCAYSPYTTCPLAPPENRLKVRIEAGEMVYKHDHGT